jgi:dihydroxy-acid dehydratase
VDLEARSIELDVPADELARRRGRLGPLTAPAGCGWLSVYARSVRPLSAGATLGG